MKWLSGDYKERIMAVCNELGISYEKLSNCPRCYNDEFIAFQWIDADKHCDYIDDSTPAKILMTIIEEDGELTITPAEDIKEYLKCDGGAEKANKCVSSIIGLAIGDAMGVPLEFTAREKLLEQPVTSMLGYGSHNMPAGSWSDDTTMTICEIESFNRNNKFDYDDIMTNYIKWVMDGEYTPEGKLFDIGRTCLKSIMKYYKGEAIPIECGGASINSNGNGSLMRILPVALYSFYQKLDERSIINLTNEMSSLTHRHDISKLGCYIYVRYVMFLLDGFSKEECYLKLKELDYSAYNKDAIETYGRILNDDIRKYKLDDINSSGYVVDTLEASLWVLLNTESFDQAIIGAINFGQDTDTIGAVVGSMAGIIYDYEAIPGSWIRKLIKKDYLVELANEFDALIKTAN